MLWARQMVKATSPSGTRQTDEGDIFPPGVLPLVLQKFPARSCWPTVTLPLAT